MENNNAPLLLKSFKIGRKQYEIKRGDYIQYNGSCYLFCSGDDRILKMRGFDMYRHLTLPKAEVKKIPFDAMIKQKIAIGIVRYYF
jgi:hypothetical protein